MTTRNSDLHTVLRHLVHSAVQWGGNQGAKAEAVEALDRLSDDDYDANANAEESGEHPKANDGQDPVVGGDLTAGGAAKPKTPGARRN